MGTLSMKVLIVLVSVLACAVAQNVMCGKGTTNKEVTVEDKKTYTFKTQKGKKYPGNTKCTVNYKMGSSCAKMSFACTKFSVKNNDKKKCLKGDKLTVTANGKSKSYCKPKPKPKVSSTGDLSVVFTSDKKKSAAGAVCKVKCIEAAGGGTGSSSSGSCSAKVSWTKKSVLSGFDKYEVFGVPAFCEVGGNKTKCQHMLSVLAAYIDNNNDGCPDNPPDFLKNVLKSTIPADEAGIGAVILTKKQSFQMPAGFQSYYGLTMWEAETRPECSGTQASDTCRDASLEEVFHLLTDKGYGPTWPAALGLYSTSNSSLTRAMDKARNPPSGTPLLTPVNGVWTYPSGAWWKHPDPTCQYNRCQTTEYHWHTTASYLGMYAGMTPDIYTYNTKEKMKAGDPLAVSIIENTSIGYRHPTVAPTGKYTGCSRCSATTGDTTSHGGAAQ